MRRPFICPESLHTHTLFEVIHELETKNRTSSNESTISNFLQTARERISSFSGKEIVNTILSSADNLLTSNMTSANETESNVPYIEPPTQNDS